MARTVTHTIDGTTFRLQEDGGIGILRNGEQAELAPGVLFDLLMFLKWPDAAALLRAAARARANEGDE